MSTANDKIIQKMKGGFIRFLDLKRECEEMINTNFKHETSIIPNPLDGDRLLTNLDQIRTVFQDAMRVAIKKGFKNKIPEELVSYLRPSNPDPVVAEFYPDGTDGERPVKDEDGDDFYEESNEFDDLELPVLPTRPVGARKNPKRSMIGPVKPTRQTLMTGIESTYLKNRFDWKDAEYADSWIDEILDSPRRRYLIAQRMKRANENLEKQLANLNAENGGLKAIEAPPIVPSQPEETEIGPDGQPIKKKKAPPSKPKLTETERMDIYSFLTQFQRIYTFGAIFTYIRRKYGMAKTTLFRLVDRVEKKKSFKDAHRTGRPPKINADRERQVVAECRHLLEVHNGKIGVRKMAGFVNVPRGTLLHILHKNNVKLLTAKEARAARLRAEGREYTPRKKDETCWEYKALNKSGTSSSGVGGGGGGSGGKSMTSYISAPAKRSGGKKATNGNARVSKKKKVNEHPPIDLMGDSQHSDLDVPATVPPTNTTAGISNLLDNAAAAHSSQFVPQLNFSYNTAQNAHTHNNSFQNVQWAANAAGLVQNASFQYPLNSQTSHQFSNHYHH